MPTSTTSAAGTPLKCRAADLVMAVEGTQGAAGTAELTLQLRNISAATCTLTGYADVQLYDKNGAALPTDTVPGGSYTFTDFASSTVALAPGAIAYVNLGYSDVPTGAQPCPAAASMWITPNGGSGHLVVTQNVVACGGKITVSPFFGSGSPQVQTTAPPHA